MVEGWLKGEEKRREMKERECYEHSMRGGVVPYSPLSASSFLCINGVGRGMQSCTVY